MTPVHRRRSPATISHQTAGNSHHLQAALQALATPTRIQTPPSVSRRSSVSQRRAFICVIWRSNHYSTGWPEEVNPSYRIKKNRIKSSKWWSWSGFHGLVRRTDAIWRFMTNITASCVTKSSCCNKLMRIDIIIVLVWYSNFTGKNYSHWQALIRYNTISW